MKAIDLIWTYPHTLMPKIPPLEAPSCHVSHLQAWGRQRMWRVDVEIPGGKLSVTISASLALRRTEVAQLRNPPPTGCCYICSQKGCFTSVEQPGAGCPSESEMNSIQLHVIAYLIPDDDMQLGGKLTFCHFCSNELNSNKFPPRYFVAARPPALLLKRNQQAQGAWKYSILSLVPFFFFRESCEMNHVVRRWYA